MNRVILREQRPCQLWPHRMELVALTAGATYEACECGTRRITITAPVTPDTGWLRSGEFASGGLFRVQSDG